MRGGFWAANSGESMVQHDITSRCEINHGKTWNNLTQKARGTEIDQKDV